MNLYLEGKRNNISKQINKFHRVMMLIMKIKKSREQRCTETRAISDKTIRRSLEGDGF